MPIDETVLHDLENDNNRNLTTLDLHYDGKLRKEKLTLEDIEALVKALSHNTVLETLILDFNDLGDDAVILLAKNLKHVKELDVRDNLIGPHGAKALAENKHIIKLNLNSNKIGDEGAKALAKNCYLRKLNIGNNNITDEGISYFAHNITLDILYFGNNRINNKGIEFLLQNERLNKVWAIGNFFDGEMKQKLQDRIDFNKKTQADNRQIFLIFLASLTRNKVYTENTNSPCNNYIALLPLELILYIVSYLAPTLGKSEAQTTACTSFMLSHSIEFNEQLKNQAGLRLNETCQQGIYYFKFFNPTKVHPALPLATSTPLIQDGPKNK